MKYSKSVIFLMFWVAGSFGLADADETGSSVTLEQIFSKMNSIKTLSYQSKIRSPAGNIARTKIWIKGNKVRADGDGIKAGQIGKRGYEYFNNKWIDSPGFSINTVITFLKEAQEAGDTKITGGQIINGEDTTIIEYTRTKWDNLSNELKVKLWVSSRNFVPIKTQVTNITQNMVQTGEISNISFEEIDETVFDDILKKDEQVKRQAKENWKLWQEAGEKGYQRALKIDEDQQFTPEQKENTWKGFRSSICKNNPYSSADDEMRSYARSRILYWMDKKPRSSSSSHPVSPGAVEEETGRDATFIAYTNGVVRDTATGLEWIAGLDVDMTWDDTQAWVQSLTVDGGGWRMPTRDELKTLYKRRAGKNDMTPLLQTTGIGIWSGEKKDSSTAWMVDFIGGRTSYRVITIDCNSCMLIRPFAVRSKHDGSVKSRHSGESRSPGSL